MAITNSGLSYENSSYYDRADYFDECIKKSCGNELDDEIGLTANILFRVIKAGILEKDLLYFSQSVYVRHCSTLNLDAEDLLRAIIWELKWLDGAANIASFKELQQELYKLHRKGLKGRVRCFSINEHVANMTEETLKEMPDVIRNNLARKLEGASWAQIGSEQGRTWQAVRGQVHWFLSRVNKGELAC